MRTPFQYGGVVDGPTFCNRAKEIADLLRAVENAEKMLIYSERRTGKTSLVLQVKGRKLGAHLSRAMVGCKCCWYLFTDFPVSHHSFI